ncbi:MAG: A/G-specific adenine glycosylase [Clostridia bacterium]|nr:A/G-specific adenine glycosylase [Clostridia bacterium]
MIPKGFVSAVVAYFAENGRVLPWREGRDPYRIWISEIMLQQTRIEAVIPYYHRFLSLLPNVSALAACPEDQLLKLWEGLGYYSRARNLKRAAERIVADFGGELPREAALLRTLPGIGEYTAGAIASIAYGRSEPAVDGNVLRVLARVMGDDSDVALPATKKRFTALLSEVYPEGDSAALLTEGIMEIGERICIPNGAPLCSVCPLRSLCRAGADGSWERIPFKSPKKERKKVKMTVFLLSCGDFFALRKRGEGGLLAGMWEFFHLEGHLTRAEAAEALRAAGMEPVSLVSIGSARHIFTHLEWEMRGFRVELENQTEGLEWFTKEQILSSCAIPGAFRYFRDKL